MQNYSSLALSTISDPLVRLDQAAIRHIQHYQGYPIVWREWGAGPALMLVHGGHGSWMHWAKNINTLAKHFRVLIPDMPGFGDSADFDCLADDPARLDMLLNCLEQGIEQLVGDAPLFLAGFSFGGAISGLLAPRLSQLQRLALLGCAGHGTPFRHTDSLINWRVLQGNDRQQALLQNLRAFMLSSDDAADDFALYIHSYSCEKTRFRSKVISRKNVLPTALKGVDKPVLMVWGDADVTAEPQQAANMLAQGDPQKIYQIMPGAGHWVQFEKYNEINALLLEWFVSK